MKFIVMLWLVLIGSGWQAVSAEIQFPNLTGRVVDNADLLSPTVEQALTAKLAAHEAKTSNQVVVLTIPSLGGHEIADYGYQLGRSWGIGQEDKNNGAILIVASEDRKMRIEVGYGLEGALPDGVASDIIRHKITPAFKQGDFEAGIEAGVDSMLASIADEYVAGPSKEKAGTFSDFFPFLIFTLFMLMQSSSGFFSRILQGTLAGTMAGFGAWFISNLFPVSLIVALAIGGVVTYFSKPLTRKRSSGMIIGGSSGSGGFSGGSGGFGGGSSGGGGGGGFGGGGASGGW